LVAYLVAAIVSALLVRTEYRRKRDGMPPAERTDLIIAGGSLTDMKPVREMNEHLAHLVSHTAANAIAQRQTADALALIAEIMKREQEGDRMQNDLERRAKDIFQTYIDQLRNAEHNQPQPPPRKR
jgi:hypothetical protein